MGYPYWTGPDYGEDHVKFLIEKKTLPPGKEKGFDRRNTFIETLAFAIYLKEDGKLLLRTLREKWPAAIENSMKEATELAREFQPAWGEQHSNYFVGSMTVPPGEERHGYDDRILFIETLTLAIALKEDGKILLEALKKKWPQAVESSMEEAARLAGTTLKR